MSDRSNRFEFALKSVTPADWDRFELLCRSFLASEFDNLRTIAGTNDKGRDGILFECDDPAVVLQYSITEGWRNKIKETVKRLNEKNIPCQILIFCSNQEIGPRADDLKQTLRKEGISLDVRDRTFFVERIDRSQATRKAAEEFSSQVVDGLLPRPEPLTENSPLTEPEMRSALIYLELQMRDVDMQMSLTRLCIESLVLASLADTTREKRKLFNEIVAQVHAQFPAQDGIKLRQLVRQALERLKRVRKATHLTANDSYALHFDERQRLIQTTERSIDDRKQVGRALAQRVAENARLLELDNANASDSDEFMRAIEATFEQLLERQGGDFVSALTGYGPEARRVAVYDEVRTIITARATKLKAIGAILSDLMELATDTVRSVLAEPGPVFQPYLRNLADAYILLAFLRQTPQVDKALGTLFGQGVLVLDTTVILPCFAETLLPPGQRIFTTTLRAAREAGLDVHITRGVLEEVDIHLNNSLNCYRM